MRECEKESNGRLRTASNDHFENDEGIYDIITISNYGPDQSEWKSLIPRSRVRGGFYMCRDHARPSELHGRPALLPHETATMTSTLSTLLKEDKRVSKGRENERKIVMGD